MGEFPSKYFATGNKEVIQEARIKGGKTTSLKRKYAAQLREIKKRGKNSKDEEINFFIQRLEDPTANVLDIQQNLDRLQHKRGLKDDSLIRLMQTKISLHKAHFGDKKLNMNLNINIEPDIDKVKDHLKGLLGR